MEEKDYRLIFIDQRQVGLIGMKEIFEELKSQRGMLESELKQLLVEKAGKKNYIPNSVNGEYEKALFREFRKFLGEKVEAEKSGSLESDPKLMAQYGILPTPALVINGKVKSAGRAASKPMIKKWLEE